MKTILLILLTSVCALAQKAEPKTAIGHIESDSILTYTPTEFQIKVLHDMETNLQKQIEELKKQVYGKQTEYILIMIGEPVDPKTLKFDGKKFTAKKQ